MTTRNAITEVTAAARRVTLERATFLFDTSLDEAAPFSVVFSFTMGSVATSSVGTGLPGAAAGGVTVAS